MDSPDREALAAESLNNAGPAPTDESDPPEGWLITSWIVFAATVLLIVLGANWLRRARLDHGGEDANILYPFAVFHTGLLNIVGFVVSIVIAIFARRHRRAALLALWPWTLSILSCLGVFAVGMLLDHLKR